MEKTGLQYVFRGTTIGYRGNPSSNKIPVTPTTRNPAKALAFALCAQYENGKTGVVYLAGSQTIQAFERIEANWFESDEEEVGFSVSPGEFQDSCLGYILASDLKTALQQENILVETAFGISDLSDIISKIGVMSAETIKRITETIKEQIKKM